MSKEKMVCPVCKKEFELWKCLIGKRKTCGNKYCASIFMSRRKKGIPSKRKGKSLEEEYGKKRAKEIRKKLRDGFLNTYKKENHYNYGKKLNEETKKKKSVSLKKAFKEGRMEHMKNVWKENSKRWTKENNPRWSGGWYINKYKYKMVHDDENKWRPEHRVVVERIIGRKLKRCETIHHINGIKFDNRKENLYYFPHDSYHKRYHGLKNKPILKSNLDIIK